MTTHPLLDAGVELDCALRDLLHGPASSRRSHRVRDAAATVRAELLALSGEANHRPTTIDDVQRVLGRARACGVPWVDIVAVVHHLQGG